MEATIEVELRTTAVDLEATTEEEEPRATAVESEAKTEVEEEELRATAVDSPVHLPPRGVTWDRSCMYVEMSSPTTAVPLYM